MLFSYISVVVEYGTILLFFYFYKIRHNIGCTFVIFLIAQIEPNSMQISRYPGRQINNRNNILNNK